MHASVSEEEPKINISGEKMNQNSWWVFFPLKNLLAVWQRNSSLTGAKYITLFPLYCCQVGFSQWYFRMFSVSSEHIENHKGRHLRSCPNTSQSWENYIWESLAGNEEAPQQFGMSLPSSYDEESGIKACLGGSFFRGLKTAWYEWLEYASRHTMESLESQHICSKRLWCEVAKKMLHHVWNLWPNFPLKSGGKYFEVFSLHFFLASTWTFYNCPGIVGTVHWQGEELQDHFGEFEWNCSNVNLLKVRYLI